jgi:iron complex outermembrane recepter protein
MQFQLNLLAHAIVCALISNAFSVNAQENKKTLPSVVVTADPFGNDENSQILTPAKVLAGDELRDKTHGSLGDTLSGELGVSASAFGAGSSRPIIRGLEGPRLKILQNGMAVSDLSSISNDHAVAGTAMGAQQIEILRGPAALAYGSGAIGGLINIVNDRIPTVLAPQATGEVELKRSSVDQSNGLAFHLDRAAGNLGIHADGSSLRAENYNVPTDGKLPNSFNREDNLGFGLSRIESWGHLGLSISSLAKNYGIPAETASIDLSQTRVDLDSLYKINSNLFESLRFKMAHTDYKHSELDASLDPQMNFKNKTTESRLEASHREVNGWRGKIGVQADLNNFSALKPDGSTEAVPITKSNSFAAFIVEEKEFGSVRINTGLRMESVKRTPRDNLQRSFNLASWSGGGLWTFTPGYGLGATYSLAQRAPVTAELYSRGAHEASQTYDIGNPNFKKEISNNLELSLQKTAEKFRWKGNLFQNKVKNYIYGQRGPQVDEDGLNLGDLDFTQRTWTQADATLHGAEAEASYNWQGDGFSMRIFADTVRSRLDSGENLPLQPAARQGLSVGYKEGAVRGLMTLINASAQNRIPTHGETTTPSYTQLDTSLHYTQRYGSTDVVWFVLGRNLLNDTIRLSTSLLKDTVPLAGRSVVLGVRTRF